MATTNKLQQVLDNILNDKNTNLKPKNLKKGITVLGIKGNLDGGTDTSDATATASDILEGKTAYVNDEKITGSYIPEDLEAVITTQEQKLAELEQILLDKSTGGEDATYEKLFEIASSIYNPDDLPDDSETVDFTDYNREICLQKSLIVLNGKVW